MVAGCQQVVIDHAVVYTVSLGAEANVAAGHEAIARILMPLGCPREPFPCQNAVAGSAASYVHEAFPRLFPCIVVHDIAVAPYDSAFRDTALQVFGASREPVTDELAALLSKVEVDGRLSFHEATNFMLFAAGCFDRHLEAYRLLAEGSREVAWVATEGRAPTI